MMLNSPIQKNKDIPQRGFQSAVAEMLSKSKKWFYFKWHAKLYKLYILQHIPRKCWNKIRITWSVFILQMDFWYSDVLEGYTYSLAVVSELGSPLTSTQAGSELSCCLTENALYSKALVNILVAHFLIHALGRFPSPHPRPGFLWFLSWVYTNPDWVFQNRQCL